MDDKDSVSDYIYVIVLGTLCALVVIMLILGFCKADGAIMDFFCNVMAWAILIAIIVIPLIAAFSDDGKGRK